MSIKIAIDDGHGKETLGKRTPEFSDGTIMKENEFNEKVAFYLDKALKNCGFETILVAPESYDVSLRTRVQRANDAGANVYISIHANAYGNNWNLANGIETWIYEKVMGGSETERLAKEVQKELVQSTGRRNRGIKRSPDLYVLHATKMHAVLVECGFMTNKDEADLLRSDSYRKKCADAICNGVCSFYGIQNKNMNQVVRTKERYHTIHDVPEWGKPTIQKLIHSNGFANPNDLDLSEDMVRIFVIQERANVSK